MPGSTNWDPKRTTSATPAAPATADRRMARRRFGKDIAIILPPPRREDHLWRLGPASSSLRVAASPGEGSEQLEVLGPLPVRHPVAETGQLVPPHHGVGRHELLAEELRREGLGLERRQGLLQ